MVVQRKCETPWPPTRRPPQFPHIRESADDFGADTTLVFGESVLRLRVPPLRNRVVATPLSPPVRWRIWPRSHADLQYLPAYGAHGVRREGYV